MATAMIMFNNNLFPFFLLQCLILGGSGGHFISFSSRVSPDAVSVAVSV